MLPLADAVAPLPVPGQMTAPRDIRSKADHADPPTALPQPPARISGATISASIIGLDLLGDSIALSSVIFTGALAMYHSAGFALLMLSSVIAVLAAPLSRSLAPAVIMSAQQTPLAPLLPAFAIVGTSAASAQTGFATIVALLGLTTVLTGIALWVLARFNLGRIVRFLPYPVSAGFLAAAGALMCHVAVANALSSPDNPQVMLIATLGVAAALFVGHLLLGERGLVAALLLVLVGCQLLPLPASLQGIITPVGPLPQISDSLGHLLALPMILPDVDTGALVAALPNVLVAVMIALLAHYLSVGAIQFGTGIEMEDGRTAQTTGTANLAVGAIGGAVVFPSPSSTETARSLHGDHWILPFALAALLLGAVLVAPMVLALVPPFVSGGLLIFLGARVLREWLIIPRRSLPLVEWLLSVLIVAVSLVFGILPAVSLGGVLASLLFVVTYCQLPVVRRESTLAARRSTIDRSEIEARLLDQQADRVVTLQVEGFLFFGTVDQVSSRLTALCSKETAPRSVILDCERLQGADAATVATLERAGMRAGESGHRIIVAGGPANLSSALARKGALAGLMLAADVETALAEAEHHLLDGLRPEQIGAEQALRDLIPPALLEPIIAHLDRVDIARGDYLIRAGDTARDVFILDQGSLGIYVARPSGPPLLLRIVRPGAIVGEMATYLGAPRTADVRAETKVRALVMTAATLDHLRETRPDIHAAWHAVMARAMAEKLQRTTRAMADRA